MSSALPQKYIPSIRQEDGSPPRARRKRDSASPETREYETQGGGNGSRRRSPGRPRRDREDGGGRYDPRSSRDGPGDDRRGGGGGGRPKDNGYEGRRVRVKEEGYGEGEREKERDNERKKYDEGESTAQISQVSDKPAEAPKPNFAPSGLLAKETNTVKGVQLKYNEPPEARKPLKNWRLYVFKGKEQVDLVHIYRQSAYLVGRDEIVGHRSLRRADLVLIFRVTDIQVAHPSCSKQHAVIQYRQITEKNQYGDATTSVKPFVIDLDSTNGTFVNDQEIPKSRYYELRNTDVIKFGTSSREYVLLHEDASA